MSDMVERIHGERNVEVNWPCKKANCIAIVQLPQDTQPTQCRSTQEDRSDFFPHVRDEPRLYCKSGVRKRIIGG